MNKRILVVLISGIMLFFSITTVAQINFNVLQITHPAITKSQVNNDHWFGIIELPFMIFSVFFAFATANKLRNQSFGKGMKLLAWGFLVMATGHVHMQVEHFMDINLFGHLLGETGGQIIWAVALLRTWGLSALGIYYIYKSVAQQAITA